MDYVIKKGFDDGYLLINRLISKSQDTKDGISDCLDGEILKKYIELRNIESEKENQIKHELLELMELVQLLEMQMLLGS